jgi:hypothetical protein
MTASEYGPDKPCRRSGCVTADVAGHLGGAHLDPGDRDHYDGIVTLYNASPYQVRKAVGPLLVDAGSFGPPPGDPDIDTARRALVEIALDACLREIDRLRQQVAAVRVDGDRKVREAMARSADCAAHGEEIRTLNDQLTHWAADRDRVERARIALLEEHHALRDVLDACDGSVPGGDVVAALTKIHKRAGDAHQRAYR